ncbi:MAG: GNAT family N-acetyltransferase [Gammaproteobacteria bacterium]|nr:GNAT family N-acetyltransferase [Gammaproteobacteria bacterium]MCP5201485.1 GNAT family N-acetyltransferase [Gammaproteobacteria bacterium]
MRFAWIHEQHPTWDTDKQHIIGAAPPGVFDRRYAALAPGAGLANEWWRVEDAGETVGYGWLDTVWGDAEILLATAPAARGRGVGSFILERLAGEARARGLNYLYNVVRPSHPEGDAVRRWLEARGFSAAHDGSLTRAVHREGG